MMADGFLVYDLFWGKRKEENQDSLLYSCQIQCDRKSPAEIVEALARMRCIECNHKPGLMWKKGGIWMPHVNA